MSGRERRFGIAKIPGSAGILAGILLSLSCASALAAPERSARILRATGIRPASSERSARILRATGIRPAWQGDESQKTLLAQAPNQYLPASSYLPLLDLTPPRFQRIEPDDGTQVVSDYYEQVMAATNHHVFRFVKIPITVYIKPTEDPYYAGACLRAFRNWELRSNGLVRFAQVTDPAQGRIRVIWSHLGMPNDPTATEFGAHTITEWHRDPASTVAFFSKRTGTVAPQTIEVNLDTIAARDADLRLLLLQNVVTHELGHALGIIGHSPDRGDMMYKDTDEFSRISQRDLNTLRKLYGQRADFVL